MKENKKASAVLLKYKRLDELKEIINYLKTFPHLIDEIIVWDNTKINMCGYGRYLGALEAKNEIIYTQDDDCIVNDIEEIFKAYDGKQLVNNMIKRHIEKYKNTNHTLPGWGMIFNKSWIKVLNKYIKEYGVDNLFIRDTGRIFTGLVGNWKTIIADVKIYPSGRDKDSLYKQRNHLKYKKLAIERIDILNKKEQK